VLNGMSRYHLCIEALRHVPRLREQAQGLISECNNLIARAVAYSREHLEDMPEITNWVWTG
jgi:xylulose-5-phosphate/fructose-6-phosphate phosphoketolase